MQPLKASVRNGRLVLDDEFNDQERAQLRQALDESIEQMKAGKTIDVAEALAELRAHR
jgi:hypothetical protein